MQGIIYSFFAGLSTVIGAIIVFYMGKPKQNTLSALLGAAMSLCQHPMVITATWQTQD